MLNSEVHYIHLVTTKPEKQSIFCVIQRQQNVGIFADVAHKVLHVDKQIEARYLLRLRVSLQQRLRTKPDYQNVMSRYGS